MSRLECLGKSSTSSQKKLAVDVTCAHAERHKPNDKAGKKTVTDKPRRSLPVHALPGSVQVSCQETKKSGFPSGEVQNTDECSPEESINTTPRVEEQTQSTAEPDEKLEMKDLKKAQTPDSAPAGGKTQPVEPLPTHKEEEQTEEEVDEDEEDIKAPVELIMEFLRAVMDRDFQLANKLCRMILIFEPDNPEASEFLPLIHKKLLEEQEAEQSTEEDEGEEDEDDDDSDDSESDESSQSSSSSSCSSSSPSDADEEEEEKQGSRHKPCPPSL